MSSLIYQNQRYDITLIATWIKYKRLEMAYSQEYLAKGICSVSHLSYFENGKKQLREELVIALIERLGFTNLPSELELGSLRHQFYNMFQKAQLMDRESAMETFKQISANRALIIKSPYAVEYKVYEFFHNAILLRQSADDLKTDTEALEKILKNLSEDLKHVLCFTLGKHYYRCFDPEIGIEYMKLAESINRTAYTEYQLGFMYGFENQPLKGVYHLEKALKLYENSGYYINAMWTNNYLGIFTSRLGDQNRALKHYQSALNAANFFQIEDIKHSLYINLSHYYSEQGDPSTSLDYCNKALSIDKDPILPASNKSEVLIDCGQVEEAKALFVKYLADEYRSSRYYLLLRYNYLRFFHKREPIFEEEILEDILPFYKKLHYVEIVKGIQMGLIEYYESKRYYKKANKLYKEILKHAP